MALIKPQASATYHAHRAVCENRRFKKEQKQHSVIFFNNSLREPFFFARPRARTESEKEQIKAIYSFYPELWYGLTSGSSSNCKGVGWVRLYGKRISSQILY